MAGLVSPSPVISEVVALVEERDDLRAGPVEARVDIVF